MKEFMIKLESVADVARFVAIATEAGFPITVTDGENSSGCSGIMELVCLNLKAPLVAKALCTDEQFTQLLRKVEPFLTN